MLAERTTPERARHVRVRVSRGLDIPVSGAAPGGVEPMPTIQAVAVFGADAPGLHLRSLVAVGDRVDLGQPLLEDRTRPALRVTAPAAGRVQAIHQGERRTIESVEIALGEGGERRFRIHDPRAQAALERADLVERLCESGLWCALRTRPFGNVPDPHAQPDAIFVTAIDTQPLAPSPEVALAEHPDEFAQGLGWLTRLTDGDVHLCRSVGSAIACPDHPRIVDAEFEGPHPAGLAGTHIHHLAPLQAGRGVWTISYADVVAIGKLLATGRLWVERIVSVAGPGARRPGLVRARLGASTEDLVRGRLVDGACRIVSGSVCAGRTAAGRAAFLGRRHLQLSVLVAPTRGERAAWWGVGRRGRARRLLPGRGAGDGWISVDVEAAPGPFVPISAFERVLPLDLPIAPLLRALVVGDVDAARALGALALEEEDLALCSFLCPSGIDYGRLLRRALDRLEAER